MLNIDQMLKDILKEFKYQPELKYNFMGYLKQYDDAEFINKCLKINIKLNDYEAREKLLELNKLHDYEIFNQLVNLYNDCLRYKAFLEDK